MSWLRSWLALHTLMLLTGLLLYWVDARRIFSGGVVSWSALCGSSLYDPTKSPCTSASPRPSVAAG